MLQANLSVDQNWVQIIKGLVLLAAVAFDVHSKMQGERSFIGMMIAGLNRTPAEPPAAPAPLAYDVTDSNRSSSPSGAQTLPQDLPHGLDKVSSGTSSLESSE